jgi:hypothetical protein
MAIRWRFAFRGAGRLLANNRPGNLSVFWRVQCFSPADRNTESRTIPIAANELNAKE